MSQLQPESSGPPGDSSRHLPLAELDAALRALPAPPKDSGILTLIVARRADGVRETPQRVRLTPEAGVPGDRWARRPPLDAAAQLTVMRADVARLIANGQPLTLFGDNLFVDLDISAANLPVGTRLRVGEAIVEVTANPHNGCGKFKQRFGADALHFVNAPPTRDQNRRGIYWTVVQSGDVHAGASVRVLSRGGHDSNATV